VAKTLHENAGIGTENEAAHGDIARYSVALECRQFGGFDSLVVYSPPEALPFGVIVGTLLALRAVQRCVSKNSKHMKIYCRVSLLSSVSLLSASSPALRHICSEVVTRKLCGYYNHSRLSSRVAQCQGAVVALQQLTLAFECTQCRQKLRARQQYCCVSGQVRLSLNAAAILDDGTAQAQLFAEGDVVWQLVPLQQEDRTNLADKLYECGTLALRRGTQHHIEEDDGAMAVAHELLEHAVSKAIIMRRVEVTFRPAGMPNTGFQMEVERLKLGRSKMQEMTVSSRAVLNAVSVQECNSVNKKMCSLLGDLGKCSLG